MTEITSSDRKPRTARLDDDVRRDAVRLFGTITNALDRLALPNVSYDHARRAFRGDPIPQEVADAISDSWRAWLRTWVVRGRPRPFTFDVERDA
jgi:hypothetical protein